MSLRARLVLVTVIVGGLGLLAMNLAVYAVVRNHEQHELDSRLSDVNHALAFRPYGNATGYPRRARAADLADLRGDEAVATLTPSVSVAQRDRTAPRTRERLILPGEVYTELRDTDGRLVAAPVILSVDDPSNLRMKLPGELPVPTERGVYFDVSGTGGSSDRYRAIYRESRAPNGEKFRTLTAIPGGLVDRTLVRLREVQIGATIVILLAVTAAGYLLVRRSLRPLHDIQIAAATIAAGDLSHRMSRRRPRTEIGRLSNSLNEMMTQIESAFAEKQDSQEQLRRFLADASHELRTPLTVIRGYAQLHRRTGGSDRKADEAMARIEDASVRMSAIVETLLALARHEQGHAITQDPADLDLTTLVTAVVEEARIAAPRRSIRLDVGASPRVHVSGDRIRLHQAIANVVDNAVQHTPTGTLIEVTLTATDAQACIAVTDRGPGIAAEHLERLFDPFYRVDPGRSRHRGGAGLGLAIASATVEGHGGSISVTSTPGDRTTFAITIPRRPKAEKDAATFDPAVETAPVPG